MSSISSGATRAMKMPSLRLPAVPKDIPLDTAIYWILRISCGGCFIFHGLLGIFGKESWLPFFQWAGIYDLGTSYALMKLIGAVDIVTGSMMLFIPNRPALMYIFIWSVWTAVLRPLTGDPWWTWIERAHNFGPPFVLLLYVGMGKSIKDWFRVIEKPTLTPEQIEKMKLALRVTIGLFLMGHGAYAIFQGKLALISNYSSVGLPGPLTDPETFLIATGLFEFALAAVVMSKPLRPILVIVLVWKVFTESLWVTAGSVVGDPWHAHILLTLERIGMYIAPAALIVLLTYGDRWISSNNAPESLAETATGATARITTAEEEESEAIAAVAD